MQRHLYIFNSIFSVQKLFIATVSIYLQTKMHDESI